MPRYFIEVAYLGTRYSGFQVQANAETVQGVLEGAMQTLLRRPVGRGEGEIFLTGSSRTDAGVHAAQNFFHFDWERLPPRTEYSLNALLPSDVSVTRLLEVVPSAHCRFDALSRYYTYSILQKRDPFRHATAWVYPFPVDMALLQRAAKKIGASTEFHSFAKTNAQNRTTQCCILRSEWEEWNGGFLYHIEGDRFLRGMVRMLTGAMLAVSKGKLSWQAFEGMFGKNPVRHGLSVPPQGLRLEEVRMPLKISLQAQ